MEASEYAVVCYVAGEPGAWAESFRRELTPGHAHLRAHITLLQPRPLNAAAEASTASEKASGKADSMNIVGNDISAAEPQARNLLQSVCRELAPIRVSLGEVKNFLPLHPTVYVEVEHGARHLRYINDRLNHGALRGDSPWDYVPHLTLATFDSAAPVAAAHQRAVAAWQAYSGAREFVMREFTLVCEQADGLWLDVESFALAR